MITMDFVFVNLEDFHKMVLSAAACKQITKASSHMQETSSNQAAVLQQAHQEMEPSLKCQFLEATSPLKDGSEFFLQQDCTTKEFHNMMSMER